MKIKEVSNKAEKLIETGKEVEAKRDRAMSNVQNAQRRVSSAQSALDRASQTDEEGNPVGDVGAAQAELDAAIMDLEYREDELREAEAELDAINAEKHETIQTLDQYNAGESANLSVIKQLQAKQFGGNVAAMAASIVGQMNLAESTKAALYQSMGQGYGKSTISLGSGLYSGNNFTATSPEIEKWNSQLERLSSSLYLQYTRKYSRYISMGKLNRPLSNSVIYVTRQMLEDKGYDGRVLGYNDGTMSYVVVGTGHELQTTVHENLHQLSANGNNRGIIVKNGYLRENVQLNEAITELLTKRTLGSDYGADYSLYSGNRDAMSLIEEYMGEDVISEAYFQNKPELMKIKFESVMGEGSWKQLSEAFDDSVSDSPHICGAGIARRNYLVNQYRIQTQKLRNGGNDSWREIY